MISMWLFSIIFFLSYNHELYISSAKAKPFELNDITMLDRNAETQTVYSWTVVKLERGKGGDKQKTCRLVRSHVVFFVIDIIINTRHTYIESKRERETTLIFIGAIECYALSGLSAHTHINGKNNSIRIIQIISTISSHETPTFFQIDCFQWNLIEIFLYCDDCVIWLLLKTQSQSFENYELFFLSLKKFVPNLADWFSSVIHCDRITINWISQTLCNIHNWFHDFACWHADRLDFKIQH